MTARDAHGSGARQQLITAITPPLVASPQPTTREPQTIDVRSGTSLAFRVPCAIVKQARATAARNRKRRITAPASPVDLQVSGGGCSASSQAEDLVNTQTVGARAKKPWYTVQKEQKEELQQEVERLVAQRDFHRQSEPSRVVALLKQQLETEELRRAIREQWLAIARAQSAITGLSLTKRAPFEQYIHLGSSLPDRVATFVELKRRALHDAEQYLNERVQLLDPTLEFSQTAKFTTSDGDHCFTGFEVIPLEGFSSVKQVFDAMHVFFFNMEITWTESSSELVLREGDFESGERDVATQRFVRSTSSGALVESSTMLFSMLRQDDNGGGKSTAVNRDGSVGDSAVIVADFVDQDELFPYSPSERLRKDITAALTLKAYPKPRSERTSGGRQDSSSETVIVLTRSFFGRLHDSDSVETPGELVNGSDFGSEFWIKTMLQTVSGIVETSST